MQKSVPFRKQRQLYGAIFLILLAIEIVVALFVHDRFVRPYLGDVLVVAVVYYFVRIFFPKQNLLLPLYVFLFAAGVEVLQKLNLVGKLQITNPIFRTVLGATFDWMDLLCYAIGCGILFAIELLQRHINRNHTPS